VRTLSLPARAPEGFEELYRRHQPRIERLCRLLVADRDEAEDVTQEVFITLLREWRAPQRPMAWGAWLTRVAVNACHRRRRTRWWGWWRGAGDAFEEGDFSASETTPEDQAIGRQTRGQIVDAFRRLSLRQQEVFVLRHVEGWSTQEVADSLGLSPGTVKLHLFRANRAFRKVLGERP
jgi:RNA polymerase sigma-70 factor, ECF subfamily